MPDFYHYQKYLQAGLKEADRYLLSNDLFWPLNIVPAFGEPSYPNLTLGGLLLYQSYARPLALSPSQNAALQQLETQIEVTQTRWRVAWERKATWEFKSRLRQWGNFIKEVRVDPEDNVGYYRYEVRLRVLLELLRADIREVDPAHLQHLDSLDLILRALFSIGDFIWALEFSPQFPIEKYWYLWGLPNEP